MLVKKCFEERFLHINSSLLLAPPQKRNHWKDLSSCKHLWKKLWLTTATFLRISNSLRSQFFFILWNNVFSEIMIELLTSRLQRMQLPGLRQTPRKISGFQTFQQVTFNWKAPIFQSRHWGHQSPQAISMCRENHADSRRNALTPTFPLQPPTRSAASCQLAQGRRCQPHTHPHLVLGRTTAQGGCTHPIRSWQQAAHLAQHEDYRRRRLSVMTARTQLTYRNAHRPAYPYVCPPTAAWCLPASSWGLHQGVPAAGMHCPQSEHAAFNHFMQIQQSFWWHSTFV